MTNACIERRLCLAFPTLWRETSRATAELQRQARQQILMCIVWLDWLLALPRLFREFPMLPTVLLMPLVVSGKTDRVATAAVV
jgi:hypothetical protein